MGAVGGIMKQVTRKLGIGCLVLYICLAIFSMLDAQNLGFINDGTVTNYLDVNLPADDNINIDGRTNPRNMTLGAMRFEHTPAIPDTRAIHIDVDADSIADTHGMFIALSSTDLVAGEAAMGVEVALDTSNATGGSLEAFRVNKAGAGTVEAHGLHVDPGVDPIHQEVGIFGVVEQAWDENGGFLDVTAAFNDAGTDVVIFSANADMIHVGDDDEFNAIEVNLAVVASGAGVKPDFHYSIAGPGWTPFVPNDGTNGFRVSSTISWDETTFVAWAAVNVNGATKRYIRITRTQGGLSTPPTEDTIQVSATTEYDWDEDGDVSINQLTVNGTNIIAEPKHLQFVVFNPSAVQADDSEVCIWPVTDAAITITSITVTLDAAGNEIAGDLKYADAFIGLASPIVINDFDTTAGVRVDTSITSATVAAGKAIYISFDSGPAAAITQAVFDIVYDYD